MNICQILKDCIQFIDWALSHELILVSIAGVWYLPKKIAAESRVNKRAEFSANYHHKTFMLVQNISIGFGIPQDQKEMEINFIMTTLDRILGLLNEYSQSYNFFRTSLQKNDRKFLDELDVKINNYIAIINKNLETKESANTREQNFLRSIMPNTEPGKFYFDKVRNLL